MNRRLRFVFTAAWLALAAPAALAAFDPVNDDTDIFLANPTFASTRPNVLVFIDNSANWGSSVGGGLDKYAVVRIALKAVLSNPRIVSPAFNVGLAMFVEPGSQASTTDGAYLRFGIRQMTGDADPVTGVIPETTNKGKLIKVLDSLTEGGDRANNKTYSLAMAEMFNYFAGRTSHSGYGKTKADAGGNVNNVYVTQGVPLRQNLAGSPFPAGADTSSTAVAYTSPIVDGCQKNFIIFISNGEANDNSSSLSEALALYQAQTGTTPTTIPLSPAGSEGNLADEYAKFMANGDCNSNLPGVQNVYTYTIDVVPGTTGPGPAHTALLKSMATNGKGKYFAITPASSTADITNALTTIFQEVQAVNSVFASTTLPVSVNVRGTNLNQVYIGVFRPDQNKSPRWFGNLKLYKLGVSTATGNLFLADRNGQPAENASTGFISGSASSFWNERNNIDFWKFRDASLNGVGGNNELPDGDLVEKGGVAQQLRGKYPIDQSTRNIYTCTGAAAGGLCAGGVALGALLSLTPFRGGDSPTTIVATGDVGAYTTVAVTSLTAVAATATAETATNHGLSAGNMVRIEGALPSIYSGDKPVISAHPASIGTLTNLVQAAGVATATTAANHDFLEGHRITIAGAGPAGYNGTFVVAAPVAATTFTYAVSSSLAGTATLTSATATRIPRFTYTVNPAPAADRARAVTSASHLLNTGDSVVIDTTPDPYDTPAGGSTATVVGNTAFEYTTSATLSGAHTGTVPFTAKSRKTITALSGTSTTARATVPAHGYGTIGSTVSGITIAGTTHSSFDTTSPVSVTILSLDSFQYTTPGTISGTANTAQAKVDGHTFTTGTTVHVRGNTQTGYNTISGTTVSVPAGRSVTRVDNNTFTFLSAVTSGGTLGSAGVLVTAISYPGGSDNTATVTTATAHGFSATAPATSIRFFGTNATFVASGSCAGYENTAFSVSQVIPPNQFKITADRRCPTTVPTGTIVGFLINTAGSDAGINPIVSASTPGYAEKGISISSITPLSSASGTITAGNPNVGDTVARDSIVNWVRGQDNKENENNDCTASPFYPCTLSNPTLRLDDVRASAHGDVLHSRPATINYSRFPSGAGPANDNDIYVFYGSNDGMLHAVKGGIASDETGVLAGDERWAFIPKEFFGKMKRLRDQTPSITNTTQKDYFFDGSIGVYQKDVIPTGGRAGTIGDDSGDKVYIYLSLRRGGNFIYALNVTDPAAPKLLWRKGNAMTGFAASPGWGELGQTWSEPKVARINWNFDGTNNPERVVLIFGAGYDDTVEDINPCLLAEFNAANVKQKDVPSGSTITYTTGGSCTIGPTASSSNTTVPRSKGRGILVVDAFTGDVLWQVGPGTASTTQPFYLSHPNMNCSISSDISVLDRDRDGIAERLYVGDTCGNLWRAEISDPDPKEWKVTRVAALSDGSNTTISGKRKFQFPPDLVLSKDLTGTFFSVLLGAGDREHPFDSGVQNTFFMVKDRDACATCPAGAENTSTRSINNPTPPSDPPSPAPPVPGPITYANLFDATNVSATGNDVGIEFGWKINLLPGEKSVGSAVTVAGTTFFNTNQPSATAGGGACGSNLGVARQYQVSFSDAAATTDLNGLGTLSIANRSTIRAGGGYLPSPVPVVVEIDGQKYQAVISGTAVQTPGGLTLDARLRTYWYKEIDQ